MFSHNVLMNVQKLLCIDCVPRQRDNDTPVVDLPWIFVVIFVFECLGGKGKMGIARQNEEMCMQRNTPSTLADILRPDFNHFSLPRDLWIFPIHLSTVGLNDSLSVHVNPKYLNSLTISIFSPFIVILSAGLFTCAWNIWATVFDTFIGCFHFLNYTNTWLQIRVPSSSR